MGNLYISEIALKKLELCNVLAEPLEDERFLLEDFYNNVIKPYSNNVALSHYAIILYYYGIHCRQTYDSLSSSEMEEQYAEHERVHLQVIELRTQLIEALEQIEQNEPPQIYLTNNQGKNRKLVYSANNQQDDVRELIVQHLKSNLCELYNKHHKGSEKYIPSDFTLDFLRSWVVKSEEEYKFEGVNRMGKPVQLGMLLSHRYIQNLSLLLRFNKLLESKDLYMKLESIVLSADDLRLIYRFLDFFGILFYKEDLNVTTQPDDIIKTRIANFNKSSSFEHERKELSKSIEAINVFSVDYKLKQFITKGI